MQRSLYVLVLAGLVASWGCGDIGGSRRNASGSAGGAGLVAPEQQVVQPAAVPAPAAPNPTVSALQPAAPAPSAAAGQPGQAPAGQAGPMIPGLPIPGAAAPQPNLVQEKAQAGVTGKGSYGGPGIVTTPISAYFQAKERVIFEIQIPHALQLYEATNGSKPKTQEEFMREIIQTYMIRLPELPAGHKYVYDPQKGELMVEHPQ
ncbi:MAG TPA: hypothetical protein VMV10_00850 [Pirellulales bacterium]|nr:hypothetical protein [Pirellulales bacterium]